MTVDLLTVQEDGTPVLTNQGIIELAYQNRLHNFFEWADEGCKEKYLYQCNLLDNTPFQPAPNRQADRTWFTPQEYQQLDLEDYCLTKCTTAQQRARAEQELGLVDRLNAAHIFKHLIYLVDVWRSNNLVWGVGRGSSVSCFLLYLIGVNKINPLDYDLDCKEFFKI
jgi:DNA polymerase III alpha subunit